MKTLVEHFVFLCELFDPRVGLVPLFFQTVVFLFNIDETSLQDCAVICLPLQLTRQV